MFFFWKNSNVSRAQALVEIDSILDAIPDYCLANMGSLTQENRSSFMDEYSSLSGARSKLNKGTTHSTLLQVLDQCKKLKLKIEAACMRHQEDVVNVGEENYEGATVTKCPSPTEVKGNGTNDINDTSDKDSIKMPDRTKIDLIGHYD